MLAFLCSVFSAPLCIFLILPSAGFTVASSVLLAPSLQMVDETLPLTFEGTEAHLPPPSSQFTSGGRTKLAHKLSVDRHAIFTLVAEVRSLCNANFAHTV